MKKLLTPLFVLVLHVGFAQYSFDTSRLVLNLKILAADSMEGRKTLTDGNKKARTYIIDQLKKIGVEPFAPDYVQSFPVMRSGSTEELGKGANIVGVIPGKIKETIVISAHYDHLGIRNDQIYNGADDNASGVAAILTMAQYFKQHKPNHRLIFAFFDAEELGLRGSVYFVKSLDLLKEKVVLNINLDMVSRSEKNELYASGGFSYPDVKSKIVNQKIPAGIKLMFGHDDPAQGHDDWTKQSDHYNFHAEKIPFVYFGVEDHPDYHRSTDKFAHVKTSFFIRSVETILLCTKALDR